MKIKIILLNSFIWFLSTHSLLLAYNSPTAQDNPTSQDNIATTIQDSSLKQLDNLLLPYRRKPDKQQQLKLNYHEKRFSLFLKEPREYQGIIEYQSPDTIIKRITTPIEKVFIIKNDILTIQENNSIQTTNLNDFPEYMQYKALFSSLLRGDSKTLTDYYNYHIETQNDRISTLLLTTKNTNPFIDGNQQQQRYITVRFEQNFLKSIIISGFGGEKSYLTFQQHIHPSTPYKQ